ncbi:MAG TPA: hypothetical protein PLS90_03590 [Candidatus Sumerlaeota bacterium]|nr:MAG: hypothetical protein BWZ08_01798 [candidate division BRC1 bacterium ADurb.BinA292]HOE97059.1 hypothetical protein [Candidatus Sumerlaeota bacterium]HPK01519.1 hypothetical protein [Candidatus Sumerlaeota bacterium]
MAQADPSPRSTPAPGGASVWRKLRDVIRHGLVIQTLLDVLRKAGLEITPYYVMREAVVSPDAAPVAGLENLRLAWLGPEDAAQVGALPDSKFSEAETRARLARGQRCLGAWVGSELAAFMWVDTGELDFEPCRGPLHPHEAYLFGATTTRARRGHNLVPHLRAELYRALRAEGRTVCYSISYAFNTPALRFKRKLNARCDRLYLYVSLWGLARRNWLLRRYPAAPGDGEP